MITGEGIIKKQSSGRGLFAIVKLSVCENDSQNSVQFNCIPKHHGSSKCFPVIESAVIIYLEKTKRFQKFEISIEEVAITAANSTYSALFYATIIALEDAFKESVDGIRAKWEQRLMEIEF